MSLSGALDDLVRISHDVVADTVRSGMHAPAVYVRDHTPVRDGQGRHLRLCFYMFVFP